MQILKNYGLITENAIDRWRLVMDTQQLAI